jgi:TP901 family phage tail tape measure protein
MATPNLTLEASVDVLLKGGRIDEGALIKAISHRLESAKIPDFLINTKFAVGGKAVSREQVLKEIEDFQLRAAKVIDKANSRLSVTGISDLRKNELLERNRNLTAIREYLNQVKNLYNSATVGPKTAVAGAEEAIKGLLAGTHDLSKVTKAQAAAAKEAARAWLDEANAIQQVINKVNKLGSRAAVFGKGVQGNIEDVSRLSFPALQQQRATLQENARLLLARTNEETARKAAERQRKEDIAVLARQSEVIRKAAERQRKEDIAVLARQSEVIRKSEEAREIKASREAEKLRADQEKRATKSYGVSAAASPGLDVLEKQAAYGKEALERGGGLGDTRGAVLAAAKHDLPYIIRYLEVVKARADEAANALLTTSGGSTKQFKDAAKEVHSYGQALDTAKERLSGHNTLLSQAGKLLQQFGRYGLGYAALYQALAGFKQLVTGIVNLDDELKSIQAISQATAEQMQTIETVIKRASLATKFSTQEIAAGAKTLAQAGVKPENFSEALGASAEFATAAGTTMDIAADLLTTMRTVYKEVNDTTLANQLTRALNISKLTAEDLKVVLSLSAQMAESFNLSSEQYLSAAAVLRNAGLKASTVATGFRQALIEVFSPDDKSIKIIAKRYAQLGESIDIKGIRAKFFSFTQEENPLLAGLNELRRLGVGGTGASIFGRAFDVRTENALKALIANFEELQKAESKITFGNAAAEAAATQMESLANSLKNLGSAIQITSYEMVSGALPGIEDLTDSLTDAIIKLGDLNTELKTLGGPGIEGTALNALLAGGAAAVRAPGGALGKAGAFVGGTLIGGTASVGTSYTGTQAGLPPAVTEAIATIVSILGGAWIVKGAKSLKRLVSPILTAATTGATATAAAETATVLGSLSLGLKGILPGIKLIGKRLASIFGPVGAFLAAIFTVVDLFKAFTTDKTDEIKRRAEAAQKGSKDAQAAYEEQLKGIKTYTRSKPGKPAEKGSTAAKFEEAERDYQDVQNEIITTFGVKTTEEGKAIYELLLRIDGEAADKASGVRKTLIQTLEKMTGGDWKYKEANDAELGRLAAAAAGVQSRLAGFVEGLNEEVLALEARGNNLSDTEKALLNAAKEIIHAQDAYDMLAGRAEAIPEKVISLFDSLLSAFESAGSSVDAIQKAGELAKKTADIAQKAIVERLAQTEDTFAAKAEAQRYVSTIGGTDEERIARLKQFQDDIDALRKKNESGSISKTVSFRGEIFPERPGIEKSPAIDERLQAGGDVVQGEILSIQRKQAENNLKTQEQVEQLVKDLREVSSGADERRKAAFDALVASGKESGVLLGQLKAGNPEAIASLTETAGGSTKLSEKGVAARKTITNIVETYPTPELPDEAFLADLETRKQLAIAEVELDRQKSRKLFTEAQTTASEITELSLKLVKDELIDIEEKLKAGPNESETQTLYKRRNDLQVEEIKLREKFNADTQQFQADELEKMRRSLDASLERLKRRAELLMKRDPLGRGGAGGIEDVLGEKGTPYGDTIRAAAASRGIDARLLAALLKQESGFNPSARSGAGAGGIAQFMPGTAAQYGLTPEERFDPEKAIHAAAAHLADLLRMFSGDVEKALAGYNAGPGAVKKYGGVPPYAETQDYVKKITGIYGQGGGSKAQITEGMELEYQALQAQQIEIAKRQAALDNLSVDETSDLIQGIKDRGDSVREAIKADKKEIEAKQRYIQAVSEIARIGTFTGPDQVQAEIYRSSLGFGRTAEQRLTSVGDEVKAKQELVNLLLREQDDLLKKIAADQNDAKLVDSLAANQRMLEDNIVALGDLRQQAIGITQDIGTALHDAFDLTLLVEDFNRVSEEGIATLARDIRETITGGFHDAGLEIADALFNPEAEKNIGERLDKVFQKLFQSLAERIFTAYFDKATAGIFGLLPGLGGKPGAPAAGAAVSGAPVADAVTATATAIKDAGVTAAKGSKGIFSDLFSGIGSIIGSFFSGLKGAGSSIIGGIASVFGFAQGGIISGKKGVDKIPGYAVGSAGVSPIMVSDGEAILTSAATSMLGAPMINSLNSDPARFLKTSKQTTRVSNSISSMSQNTVGASYRDSAYGTLEALGGLETAVRQSSAKGVTRIEVHKDAINMTLRDFLAEHFDDLIATR